MKEGSENLWSGSKAVPSSEAEKIADAEDLAEFSFSALSSGRNNIFLDYISVFYPLFEII